MTDAALLAAIRDQPYNHTVRLVYADWLDEHGNSEQANVIRSQFTGEPVTMTLVTNPWDFVCRSADGKDTVCEDWFAVFLAFSWRARFRTPRVPEALTDFSLRNQWTQTTAVGVRNRRGVTVLGKASVLLALPHPERWFTVEVGPVIANA